MELFFIFCYQFMFCRLDIVIHFLPIWYPSIRNLTVHPREGHPSYTGNIIFFSSLYLLITLILKKQKKKTINK